MIKWTYICEVLGTGPGTQKVLFRCMLIKVEKVGRLAFRVTKVMTADQRANSRSNQRLTHVKEVR